MNRYFVFSFFLFLAVQNLGLNSFSFQISSSSVCLVFFSWKSFKSEKKERKLIAAAQLCLIINRSALIWWIKSFALALACSFSSRTEEISPFCFCSSAQVLDYSSKFQILIQSDQPASQPACQSASRPLAPVDIQSKFGCQGLPDYISYSTQSLSILLPRSWWVIKRVSEQTDHWFIPLSVPEQFCLFRNKIDSENFFFIHFSSPNKSSGPWVEFLIHRLTQVIAQVGECKLFQLFFLILKDYRQLLPKLIGPDRFLLAARINRRHN